MTHPGPTHPSPSGPSQPSTPSRGHLPIGTGPVPSVGDVARDAQLLASRLITALGRQYDPESAPAGVPVDVHLGCAVIRVRQAVDELAAVTAAPAGRPRQICTGKTLGDGMPARCGGTAVHGQHQLLTPTHRDPTVATTGASGGESRARSGGPGATVMLVGRRP